MFNTIRAKLGFGFAIVIALGLLTGALGLLNAKKIMEGAQANEHTHEVLREVSLIRENMTNIETGQRGFLVTGYPTYLEPYTEGKRKLTRTLRRRSNSPQTTPHKPNDLTACEKCIRTG